MKAPSSKVAVFCTAVLIAIGCILFVVSHFRSPASDHIGRISATLPPPDPAFRPEPAPRFVPSPPPAPPPKQPVFPVVAAPPLSAAVRTLIGEAPKTMDYNDYRDALRQLTADLPLDDVRALVSFLKRKAADQTEMRPIAFNGIKNDVLDVLLRQETLPEGIGTLLVEMYRDTSYDDMWRDYCIQFMTAYYEIRWPTDAPSPTDESAAQDSERETIEAVYWDALKETDTTIAGTALLGLNSLSRQYPSVDRERLSQAAIALLGNAGAGEPSRITAFSIAASLGNQDALFEARAVAQTGETVTLRMAAIAAIGKLGAAEDVELLSSLAQDSDARIRRMAEAALKAAQKRLEPHSPTAQMPQDAATPFTIEKRELIRNLV